MLLVSGGRPGRAGDELVDEAFVERADDGDADADHNDGDFSGGPDNQADCVLWLGIVSELRSVRGK